MPDSSCRTNRLPIDQFSKEQLNHSNAAGACTAPSHTVCKASYEGFREIKRIIREGIAKLPKCCGTSHISDIEQVLREKKPFILR